MVTPNFTMESLHEKIDELAVLYKDDRYVSSRMEHFITVLLPGFLEQAKRTNEERVERKGRLLEHEDNFVTSFLSRNQYYYLPKPEQFVVYDGCSWQACSEDDIQYGILTSITSSRNLIPWKHKVKVSLVKQIKQRSPLTHLPESDTIQSVLGALCPLFFPTRGSAKHFLTLVGDSIKGSKSCTYIAPSCLKELIREVDQAYFTYLGSSTLLTNMKLKFHGHEYSSCRLVRATSTTDTIRVDNELSKMMLDLLCVANHYSKRYESADHFVEKCNEPALSGHVLFLRDRTPEVLVSQFIEEAIHSAQGTAMNSKNMMFVWKKYLDEKGVPNTVFYDTLSTILKEKLTFNEETDMYEGVTSTYLPFVSAFVQFWDQNMKEDSEAPEIEISEVISLFGTTQSKIAGRLTDDLVLELIGHTYPNVSIEEGRFICNHSCFLWNKRQDVQHFLAEVGVGGVDLPPNLYEAYKLYTERDTNILNMSKNCFDRICREEIGGLVNEHGEIDNCYWTPC